MIRIAIQSKGRLSEESLALLAEIGIKIDDSKRKFLAQTPDFPLELLYMRDDDIPQVVAAGPFPRRPNTTDRPGSRENALPPPTPAS